MTKQSSLVCSFCLRTQEEVVVLVRGQANACICGECIDDSLESLKAQIKGELTPKKRRLDG